MSKIHTSLHKKRNSISSSAEEVRTGLSVESLQRAVCEHLFFLQGRHPKTACRNDLYLAVAYAVRDRLFQRGVQTVETMLHQKAI